MKVRLIGPAVAFCVSLGWVTLSAAASMEELLEHPNSDVAQFYRQNEATIDALYREIKENTEAEARAEAFRTLIANYPQAAEVIAREFVTDPDTTIALGAIGILEGALVMTDHAAGGHEHADPLLAYMMASHEAGRAALRSALTDERPEIRERVAPFLASLSDETALQTIAEATESGLYRQADAANIVSLAGARLQGKYLPSFLDADDPAAQQTAITYLGFNPEYQSVIRDSYFINPSTDPATRAVATQVLSRYDSNYKDYALLVANEEGLNPQVYAASIAGYIDALTRSSDLSPEVAKSISANIQNFGSEIDPGLPISKTIDLLGEQLDALAAPIGNIQ